MTFLKKNIKLLAQLLTEATQGLDSAVSSPIALSESESQAEQLLAWADSGSAYLATAEEQDGRSLGLIRLLEWDSAFFGFPCAKIEPLVGSGSPKNRFEAVSQVLDQLLTWARRKHVQFVNVKVPGPDPIIVQSLESSGFYVTDNVAALRWTSDLPRNKDRVAGALDGIENPAESAMNTSSEGNPKTGPGMTLLPPDFQWTTTFKDPEIAASSLTGLFTDGRFHNDRRLGPQIADQIWNAAIKTQLSGSARLALGLVHQSRLVALATVQDVISPLYSGSASPGNLFILGVHQAFRGLGLGRRLLIEILKLASGTYSEVLVETSTYNRQALNLYLSAGFHLTEVKLTLHKWLNH